MNEFPILIAGGCSGMGLETVNLLASGGHDLICFARQPERLPEHPQIQRQYFDATDLESSIPIDGPAAGAVYFPGTITLKPFRSLKASDFQRDLEINFHGAVRFLQAALPALQKANHASIVLFSTVAVQAGLPYHASIAAAKGAVEGLTRALAAELAPKIRVNCIAPSLTATPLAENLLNSDPKIQAARDRHPLREVGDPVDMAAWVQFLLSDHAKFITGQILHVDGGISALRG